MGRGEYFIFRKNEQRFFCIRPRNPIIEGRDCQVYKNPWVKRGFALAAKINADCDSPRETFGVGSSLGYVRVKQTDACQWHCNQRGCGENSLSWIRIIAMILKVVGGSRRGCSAYRLRNLPAHPSADLLFSRAWSPR